MAFDTTFLANMELFHNISASKVNTLLRELDAKKKTYKNGETIFNIGDCVSTVAVIISGKVSVTNVDFWGNKSLVRAFLPGDFFGDSHSITHEPMFFDMVAYGNVELIMLNAEKLLFPANGLSPERYQLQANFVKAIANKKVTYLHEIDFLIKRSTRDKLLTFLSDQARVNGSSTFYIPYNRIELAEHLAVDRSALSRELSKLQQEGLIHYDKNYFDLRYNLNK